MTFDLDFIKEVADRNKHTFISTAMTSEKQIETIINIFWCSMAFKVFRRYITM